MNSLLLLRGIVLRTGDAIITVGVFWALHLLHPNPMPSNLLESLALFSVAAYLASFQLLGVYQVLNIDNTLRWSGKVMQGWTIFSLAVLSYLFVFKATTAYPRGTLIPWFFITPFLLVLLRYAWRGWEKKLIKQGHMQRRVLLIGTVKDLPNLLAHLQSERSVNGEYVAGYLTISGDPIDGVSEELLGSIEHISKVVEQAAISHVIVTLPPDELHRMRDIREALRTQPINISYAPNLSDLPFVGFRAEDRGGWPFFNLTASPLDGSGLAWKWAEDKIIALLALLVFGLPMLLIALIIKVTSPGPVFFIQERHGIHGKPIRVMKFRSMRQPKDSEEARQATAGGEVDQETGKFKQAQLNDPRITWIGGIIRKTSLDELPQIFNVLKGDMSLVGPRPHAITHNLQFIDEVDDLMQRHHVKPGMTGLAQVNGCRGETPNANSMARRVAYDLQYIREWSLLMDIKIIALTPFVGFLNKQP